MIQKNSKNDSGSPQGKPNWSHLPEALRSGGAAYAALNKAADNPKADARLVKRLQEDLNRLRHHHSLNRPDVKESAANMKYQYGLLLHDPTFADRVFCYCLAVLAGIKISAEFKRTAKEAYLQDRDQYDVVLASLIPKELPAEVDDDLYRQNWNATALGDWTAFRKRLETRRQEPLPGLSTGFPTLDKMTGGLRGVTLCAGPTGSGKTTLALNFVLGAMRSADDVGALVFSLEMSKDEHYLKLFSHLADVDYKTLRAGTHSEATQQSLAAAEKEAMKAFLPRLRVIDAFNAGIMEDGTEGEELVSTLRRTLRAFTEESGVRRPIIVVDSLQKLPVDRNPLINYVGDTPQHKLLSDLEIDDAQLKVLIALQKMTRDADLPDGVPVLALSRVNKAVHGRRLTLDDVPGKADLVHEATNVFLLEPERDAAHDPAVTPTLLNVAKVRDGGWRGEVRFRFHHPVSRFFEEDEKEAKATPPAAHGAGMSTSPKPSRFAGKARPNSAAAME